MSKSMRGKLKIEIVFCEFISRRAVVVVVERESVRDNLRPAQVPLESSGKLRDLSSNERVVRLDAVSVLQFDVSRHVRHAARTHRVVGQRGEGDLSRRLQ